MGFFETGPIYFTISVYVAKKRMLTFQTFFTVVVFLEKLLEK